MNPNEDFICPNCKHVLSLHNDTDCAGADNCDCPRYWAEGLLHEKFKAASSLFMGKIFKNVKPPLLLSFYGPSGVGKSTCYTFAKERLEQLNHFPVRLDVALPLRQIQQYCHSAFDLEDPGRPDNPEDFKQDGQLLEFLAQHFQDRLGPIFVDNFNKIVESTKAFINLQKTPLVIINTDCRNNCYTTLKDLGFIFIRVDAPDAALSQRKRQRGDLTPFNVSTAVESISDIFAKYEVNNDKGLATLAARVFSVINAVTS